MFSPKQFAKYGWLIVSIVALQCVNPCCADEPIATIAVVSNPYITTLPAEEIKDENGRNRGFLAQTAPASMQKTVDLVNRLKPDALVVLGSLGIFGGVDAASAGRDAL